MKWWTSNEKRTVLAVRFHRDRSVLWPPARQRFLQAPTGQDRNMMTP